MNNIGLRQIAKDDLVRSIGETQEVLKAINTISDKTYDPDSCIGNLSKVGISLTEIKREVLMLQVRLETMIRIATRVAGTWDK